MPGNKWGEQKMDAVEKELAKNTDAGKRRAIGLLHNYEKEKSPSLPTPKSYSTKALDNGNIEVDDGNHCDTLVQRASKGGPFTWTCADATDCKAGYCGILLDGTFFGFPRTQHGHGATKYPYKDYSKSTGRLRVLDQLLNICRAKGVVDDEGLLRRLEDAIGTNTPGEGKGTIYLKLAGSCASWEVDVVADSVEYIGETTMKLKKRFDKHVAVNLLWFTDSGAKFTVLHFQVPLSALDMTERLLHRLFTFSPRLLNKNSGPVGVQGLSRLEEQKGAALMFLNAIPSAHRMEVDWTDKREDYERKRASVVRPGTSTEQLIQRLPKKSDSQLDLIIQSAKREQQRRTTSTAESRKRGRPPVDKGDGTPRPKKR